MKKIIIILCVILIVFAAGCGKAVEPLSLPEKGDVTAISIVTPGGMEIEILQSGAIEKILAVVESAQPTAKQSVNDQPTNVESFGSVSINSGSDTTTLYYYKKDGKHYIEQPYAGIYEIEKNFEEMLPKEKLTMDKLVELSAKGEALSWGDFALYEGYDVGSGLIILRYDIDEQYYVLVGGTDIQSLPAYILLCTDGDDEGIDVRKGLPGDYMTGGLKSYSQMSDGTWMCDGYSYKYRIEITGRLPNAAQDSTYVYLSNIEDISFDQAWKAAGLSSNSNDYFSPKDAVLVDMK